MKVVSNNVKEYKNKSFSGTVVSNNVKEYKNTTFSGTVVSNNVKEYKNSGTEVSNNLTCALRQYTKVSYLNAGVLVSEYGLQ